MNFIAIKMLVGDRAKYIGILIGLTFASLLITQQTAIFCGLMTRTFGAITDLGQPDIWVMDKKVQFIDDIKPMQDTELYRVRGVSGVQWAVPLYKGLIRARLDNGNFQTCNVIGLDDATLIGGPPKMVADSTGAIGRLEDLRRSEAVIVDEFGADDKLAKIPTGEGKPIPLKIGDTLELNDHRAVVVGLCQVSRTFQSQPVVYTTYSRATTFAPQERKLLSFVLVKAGDGVNQSELCRRITQTTGLGAFTRLEFVWMTVNYFMKYTGYPDQLRHFGGPWIFRGNHHRGADVLQFHARQPEILRDAQSDGGGWADAAADDPRPGGPCRNDWVWIGCRPGQHLWDDNGQNRVGVLDAVATIGDQCVCSHVNLCNISIHKYL